MRAQNQYDRKYMCFFIDFSDFPCVLSFFCLTETGPRPKVTARQDFEEGSIEWQILELLEDDLAPKPNTFGSDLVVLVTAGRSG